MCVGYPRHLGRKRAAMPLTAGVCRRTAAGNSSQWNPNHKETGMAGKLAGKRIAFLVAPEGAEQVELTDPWHAVEEAGGKPELISTEPGEVQAFNHLDKADTFPVDHTATDADAGDYDGLVLPGGVANPDILRTDEDAVAFTRAFFEAGKPVGVICHGPWTLIQADVLRGRTITSWPSLQTDLRNAGAEWVDEEVVVDEGLVSSRKPDDLPAFCAKLVEELCEGEHEGQSRSLGSTA
jgi:protease I